LDINYTNLPDISTTNYQNKVRLTDFIIYTKEYITYLKGSTEALKAGGGERGSSDKVQILTIIKGRGALRPCLSRKSLAKVKFKYFRHILTRWADSFTNNREVFIAHISMKNVVKNSLKYF
jgi:hypothetical protein